MISEKMNSLMVEQMHRELESAYLYLAIANYYEDNGLSGFANWFMVQAREEENHAIIFYEYLHLNDARICFRDLLITCKKFKDYKEPLTEAASHEEFITESIEKLFELAIYEKDYGSQVFLSWFITEQQEEEHSAYDMVQQLEMFGTNSSGLFDLDKKMGKRVFHGCKKIKGMGD